MKLLITGSKGFIGSNLNQHLVKKHTITGYDILDGYKRPKELHMEKYDWVLHIGAVSSTTETDVQKVMDLNVSWPIELFEECVKHNTNFQWSSSASVYGKTIQFRETNSTQPENLYARSKMLLEEYIKKRDVPIVWQGFRYFNVYGNGEDHKGTQASPYTQFTKQAKETGVIKIFEGSDDFLRDFIPVESVCSYHEQFLDKKISGIFNIGTGKPKSFSQVAEEVASLYNATIQTIPFPSHLRSHYQTYTKADMSFTNSILAKELFYG
jgi:ADP-L-glycero-D-manno-heptose 6-epimerase